MNSISRGATTRSGAVPARIARFALAAAVIAGTAVACSKDTPSNIGWPMTLTSITVTPTPAPNLLAGETQMFVAVGRNSQGNVIPMTNTVWTVETSGGTIDNTGLFTAGTTAGTYPNTIHATSAGITGTASVRVFAVTDTTGGVLPFTPTVTLGTSASRGILAGQAVTCVSTGSILADVSVWPGTAVTGFPPCTISGSTNVGPGPGVAANAQADLTVAYNQLDAKACDATLTTDLGGQTLAPGVYCSTSSQGLTGEMFLDAVGDPNAEFVIKVASALTTATAKVTLLRGARAKNVYWLVGSSATIGVGSAMKGNIIALTSITLVDNATLLGRALARNGSVSLGTGNTITLP